MPCRRLFSPGLSFVVQTVRLEQSLCINDDESRGLKAVVVVWASLSRGAHTDCVHGQIRACRGEGPLVLDCAC